MNYSAAEDYSRKCAEFDKRYIPHSKVRRRLFRNFYVLFTHERTFLPECQVLQAGSFMPSKMVGSFYGPFLLGSDANQFALDMVRLHRQFLLG